MRVDGRALATLSASGNTFPFETVIGFARPPSGRYLGISLPGLAAWQQIGASPSWPRLRTLSVSTEHATGAQIPGILLGSALGKQLDQLDLVIDPRSPTTPDARTIHEVLARTTKLARLTLVGELGSTEAITLAYVRNARQVFELVIQLRVVPSSASIPALVAWIAPHGRGIDRIEIHDLESPLTTSLRHAELVRALRPLFAEVVAVCRPTPRLAPWAYEAAEHPATRAVVVDE